VGAGNSEASGRRRPEPPRGTQHAPLGAAHITVSWGAARAHPELPWVVQETPTRAQTLVCREGRAGGAR
jgi:hypothetical protein